MRTYIVLGMHRSGTSFLAKALADQGVDMGKRLMGPLRNDPIDHYENMDFVELNREILRAANGDKGFFSGTFPVPDEETIAAQAEAFGGKIAAVIEKHRGESWGWKGPYTSLLMPLYMPHVLAVDDDPFVYVAFRRPEKVAESLHRRQGTKPKWGGKIAREYNRRILRWLWQWLELDTP